jgi:hypothetical protein
MNQQISNKTQRCIRLAAIAAVMVGFAGIADAQRGGRGGFNQGNNGQNDQNQNFGGQGRRTRGSGGGFGGFGSNGNFQRMPNTGNYNDDYAIIVNQNIFLRDRRPPRDPNADRPAYVAPTAEQTLVLTGISQEGDQYYAFVEDVAQNRTLKLKAGDAVAHGKISEITIDPICYEHDTDKTWIAAGSNLSGTQVLSMTNARAAANINRFDNGNTGFQGLGGNNTFNGNNGGNNNFGNNNFGNNNQGGRGFGTGGGRGGGGGAPQMPVVTPPPLPGDASTMSAEERMRLRRQQEALPSAARVEIPVAPAAPVVEQAPAAVFVPNDGLTVEERMRRNRLQETGGAPQ